MSKTRLSFVVSTCNRPAMLPVILNALAVQTMPYFEVIVTDNSTIGAISSVNRDHVERLGFSYFDTAALALGNCYQTANWAVEHHCSGDFLCFPSDDSYYVPVFADRMLAAAEGNGLDLVYCNMVYDTRFNGQCYSAIDVQPILNSIDKTGFIVRRSRFQPFPNTRTGDGELIELLVSQGIRHGKLPDVLMVHN